MENLTDKALRKVPRAVLRIGDKRWQLNWEKPHDCT